MPNNVPAEVTRERESRAWELRQKCYTQERIAAELGIDQSTVCKILGRVNKRYLKAIQSQLGERKAEQTAQLEKIAEDALESFRGDPGNARLLQAAMQALEGVRKIWGIDAPSKQELSGAVQTVGLTLDQWKQQAGQRREQVEQVMSDFEDGDGE